MRSIILPLLLSGIFAAGAPAQVQHAKSGLLTRSVTVGGTAYGFQVFVPAHLTGKRDVPVIVFLHGIGQRGEGGFIPNNGAIGSFARQYLEQMQAVVVIPQCRKGQFWHDAEMDRMVMAQLEQTAEEFSADRKRFYLAGVSMGGYGAWHLAGAHPGKFAAVVAICGGSPVVTGDRFTPLAQRIGRTPVWAFHGSDDRVVPVSESRQMVEALKRVEGNRVRYNEYKGVGHNVWLNAAAEPDLLSWLLGQRLE